LGRPPAHPGRGDNGRGVGTRVAIKDLLAALAFVGFGLAFAVVATSYQIGTTFRMGPGYFPLVLGALLVLLGVLILVKGFLTPEGGPVGALPWKATILIVASVLFFGLTLQGLGLVPSLFVTVLLTAFAGQRPNVLVALLTAIGLTALSVLIFVVALNLRLPLFGPWVGA
jgi:hypothetical protein